MGNGLIKKIWPVIALNIVILGSVFALSVDKYKTNNTCVRYNESSGSLLPRYVEKDSNHTTKYFVNHCGGLYKINKEGFNFLEKDGEIFRITKEKFEELEKERVKRALQ